jgi:hypothetical protein
VRAGVTTDEPAVSTPNFASGGADTQARVKFLQKFRKARTSFQGGTFLGELGEALNMIKRPGAALRAGLDRYYGAAKEAARRAKSARGKSGAIAGTWLEYQYGWRPLVSDIEDAFRAVNDFRRKDIIHISATGTTDQNLGEYTTTYTNGFFRCYFRYLREGSVSVRYKGAVRCSVSESPWTLENWGLNTSNFVPTVYNLIPYSFIVDYFSNIGQVIDGMSLGRVEFTWGVRTERQLLRRCLMNIKPDDAFIKSAIGAQNRYNTTLQASGFTSEAISFSRSPVFSLDIGVADVQLKVPGISSNKWMNLAALARMKLPR